MLEISNDPLKMILQAANELWPDMKADIQWQPALDLDKKEYGCTIFPDDSGTPLIELNPAMPFVVAIEILAHEIEKWRGGQSEP